MADADRISITICGDGGCDSYSVSRTIDGRPYHLSLTDTAGQEEYRGLWASSNLQSDAFLLVYDITNPSSLHTMTHFLEMIDMEAENRAEANGSGRGGNGGEIAMPVKIVAGNKCDLKDERLISSREGLEWARSRGCGFMETSAREMVNIEETFALIVRRVVAARAQAAQNSTQHAHSLSASQPTGSLWPPIGMSSAATRTPHRLGPLSEKDGGDGRTGTTTGSVDLEDRHTGRKVGKRGFWGLLRCW
ncbi:hypothetical protein MMC09_002412 [Bachmanniomyces sp. S44760]|nr:hypothetical protein [Bachmanniomyces sp. S44760]